MALLRARLGLTGSAGALLGAILLIGMGQEIAKPFLPKFVSDQASPEWLKALVGPGVAPWLPLLLVGLYGTCVDFMEAIYYATGGRLSGRLGMRRSLLLFTLLPVAGAAAVAALGTPLALILAVPFLQGWDAISLPATLTVVGASMPAERRTLAFSLQAILRRVPRVLGFLAGGGLVAWLGVVAGVRWAMVAFVVLAVAALLVQRRFLSMSEPDKPGGAPLRVRDFPTPLKRLLVSDILARWCEGLPRDLFVLMALGSALLPGNAGVCRVSGFEFGALKAEEAAVALLLYLPMGFAASKSGYAKKPFIGVTFLFFAAFPLAFVLLGPALGLAGFAAAYLVAGLREIGEPARKAMITELVPADLRTRAIGLYWSVRSLAVMAAPMTGVLLWIAFGPRAPFYAAFAFGLAGALFFWLRFGDDGYHPKPPAS